MAGRRLFSKALTFLTPSSPPLRRHFAAGASADTLQPRRRRRSESLLTVLESRGLAAADIAAFGSRDLLHPAGDVGSKFDLLRRLGYSASDVARILRYSSLLSNFSPASLNKRIEFLKSAVGDDGSVRKVIKKSIWTLSSSGIEKQIADNMAMFKEWGLSDTKIRYALVSHTRFFLLKSQSILAAAELAQTEFGISRDHKMFLFHVIAFSAQSDSKRREKITVFERFGWRKSDVHALARSYPMCFGYSPAKLEKGLEFLMNTAGFSPADIVSGASMLGMNLEGRVSPRYHLIQALKSKSLLPKNMSFYSAVCLSEKDFRRKFVDKFAEVEPDACKTYVAAVTLPQNK